MTDNNTPTTDPLEVARAAADAARAAKGLPALSEPTQEHVDDGEVGEGVVVLDQFTATIQKDEVTAIPVEVFGHELPILYFIYGEDMIQVLEQKTRRVQVENFDVDSEFDRLMRKYESSEQGRQAIAQVYGQPYRLAEELGLPSHRPKGAYRKPQAQASLNVDHLADGPQTADRKVARILPSRTLRRSNAPGVKPAETPATTRAKTANQATKESGKPAQKAPKAKTAAKPKGASSK